MALLGRTKTLLTTGAVLASAWLAGYLLETPFARPLPPRVQSAVHDATEDDGADDAGDEAQADREPGPEDPPALDTADAQEAPTAPIALETRRIRTPPLTETRNVLVVGADRRPDTGRGGRPDTLIVAVLDDRTDHVGLVSVPRDLYVEIPGHGPARINAAFGIARRRGEEPMSLLRRVVEDTLALPIGHTVLVDLAGFEALVDAVGGVPVDVPCAIRDRFVDVRAPGGRRVLDVSAGRHHFDGPTASMYVRSRHGRSDFSRARRQQAVALGIRSKLGGAEGLVRLPGVLDAVGGMLTTDMTRLELLRLARRGARADATKLHGLVFGARETSPHRTPDGRSVLLPRYDAIDAALSRLFEAPPPGERPDVRACPPADVALTRSRGAEGEEPARSTAPTED